MGEENKCVKLYYTSVASTSSVRNERICIKFVAETSIGKIQRPQTGTDWTVTSKYGNFEDLHVWQALIVLYKGLNGVASIPTNDLVPQLGISESVTFWHFNLLC